MSEDHKQHKGTTFYMEDGALRCNSHECCGPTGLVRWTGTVPDPDSVVAAVQGFLAGMERAATIAETKHGSFGQAIAQLIREAAKRAEPAPGDPPLVSVTPAGLAALEQTKERPER